MNIEKTISDLPNTETRKLKDLLMNANRVLSKDPKHLQAAHLRDALTEELARRKVSNRTRVGPLWWEPHDPDVAEFFAYDEAQSTIPVAAIFKRATHTATRKAVYSVRIISSTDGLHLGSFRWQPSQLSKAFGLLLSRRMHLCFLTAGL